MSRSSPCSVAVCFNPEILRSIGSAHVLPSFLADMVKFPPPEERMHTLALTLQDEKSETMVGLSFPAGSFNLLKVALSR